MWIVSFRSILFAVIFLGSLFQLLDAVHGQDFPSFEPLVTKESRRTIVSTDSGVITAVDVHDGYNQGTYHLQLITMDTSSLFLPVILHADMVFYVNSGRGNVNWIAKEGDTNRIEVRRGDIYRLEEGTVFYVQSHTDPTREKLRIHAIFNTVLENTTLETSVGPYSKVSDLVHGFDDEILQKAFRVSEEDIRAIKWVQKPPPIVHYEPKNETDEIVWREGIFEALIGRHQISIVNKKKEKKKTFNIFESKPDIKNCNGQSIAVTSRNFRPLRGSNMAMFMVNLTRGSMMGPHWNPTATEISIVTHGQGMVQVVCPSNPSGTSSEASKCQNTKFKVSEGDIFIVPRYHPMVQISFNNDLFVFVGFSTMVSQNHPQFLVGKRSVLKTIDRDILAISYNAANTTIDRLLDSQVESVMLECASCAEALERKMEEEIERKRQEEEARKKKAEEARKKEEEASRREEEEKEARRREEEEREKEEERRRQEKEERKKEEEAARRREEEERKREEKEAGKREEEEEAQREQEEAKELRRREEEEARAREEEEEARREEEEREPPPVKSSM